MTEFEVVHIEQMDVLSGDTAEQLRLMERLYTVQAPSSSDRRCRKNSEAFQTTGTLPTVVSGAQGVVYPLRKQLAALKQMVVLRRKEMEQQNIITPLLEPTDRVSTMVAVPRNSQVHICIGPSEVNKAIKREHYPMRTWKKYCLKWTLYFTGSQ